MTRKAPRPEKKPLFLGKGLASRAALGKLRCPSRVKLLVDRWSERIIQVKTKQNKTMADLDVQPKRRRAWWLWLLLLLVVLAVLFFLARGREADGDTATEAEEAMRTDSPSPQPAVSLLSLRTERACIRIHRQ